MDVELSDLTDTLARDCIDVKEGRVLILADNSNMVIGERILESVEKNFSRAKPRESPVLDFNILANVDQYRKGKAMEKVPEVLKGIMTHAFIEEDIEKNALVYIFAPWDGEQPMRKELADFMKSRGKLGGLPGCTLDVLTAGLHPMNRQEFGLELQAFMEKQSAIYITSFNGTYLCVELDHRYKFINSNGKLKGGAYRNPIMGEVYTHPASVSGKMVISGSYGPLMGHPQFLGKHAELAKALSSHPITWIIEDGRVTDVQCNDEVIRKFVCAQVFERDPENGDRIGELGLPTNLYMLQRELTGNLLIDEKGRVHLAHGHGYPNMTGAKYDTAVHGDGLIAEANLYSPLLDKDFMTKNRYNTDIFKTLR